MSWHPRFLDTQMFVTYQEMDVWFLSISAMILFVVASVNLYLPHPSSMFAPDLRSFLISSNELSVFFEALQRAVKPSSSLWSISFCKYLH